MVTKHYLQYSKILSVFTTIICYFHFASTQNISVSTDSTCSILFNKYLVTFDGITFTFPAKKQYIVAQSCDQTSPSYHVGFNFAQDCNADFSGCQSSVKLPEFVAIGGRGRDSYNLTPMISIGHRLIYLYPGGDIVSGDGDRLPDPTTIYGVHVYGCGNNIVVAGLETGLTIIYDGDNTIHLLASPSLSGHLCGLCGHYNHDTTDELSMFAGSPDSEAAYSWIDPFDTRDNPVFLNQEVGQQFCSGYFISRNGEWVLDAVTEKVCVTELTAMFGDCVSASFLTGLRHVCVEEFCQCRTELDGLVQECLQVAKCVVGAEASMACGRNGISISEWRSHWQCESPTCQSNLEYSDASSMCGKSCGFHSSMAHCGSLLCDGCYCAEGSVWNGTSCISPNICPCRKVDDAQIYHHGDVVDFNNCETCECSTNGIWKCVASPNNCHASCNVLSGFFTTFDRRQFTYRGSCLYTLVMFSGNTNDNIPAFSIYLRPGSCNVDTCSESTIFKLDYGDRVTTITLSGQSEVMINEQITQPPYWTSHFTIHAITNEFIEIATKDGVIVYYGGPDRIYITLDPQFHNKVQGLCGNYNNDVNDDNMTPSGDHEEDTAILADHWKLYSYCISTDPGPLDKCVISSEYVSLVQEFCNQLKAGEFLQCNSMVDVSWYHSLCVDSMCRCEAGIDDQDCRCYATSAYARECAKKGLVMSWRSNDICAKAECSNGRTYQACGSSCIKLCGHAEITCKEECQDGCSCAQGDVWDVERAECVPEIDCPCLLGTVYWPAQSEQRINCSNCTCIAGNWSCGIQDCRAPDACTSLQEWSSCSECARTCSNHRDACVAVCQIPGCVCSNTTVYSPQIGDCVPVAQCNCTFLGKTYRNGEVARKDCNTCTCQDGYMVCEEKICEGMCEASGEPHFWTFDKRAFDFHGSCNYILATDHCGNTSATFSVEFINIPCGIQGYTCKKLATIYFGSKMIMFGDEFGTYTVADNPRNWYSLQELELSVTYRGFLFEINLNNNVTVSWDGRTRLVVTVQPLWSGRLCGLCGNYDQRSNNDFVTSTGLSVTNAYVFGNSWRTSNICPLSIEQETACSIHPERTEWAESECAIVLSIVFAACHIVVDYQEYYHQCVYDSCLCSKGGDCVCYCDAVARYAYECGRHGVCIEWRSNRVCPMQPSLTNQTYVPCAEGGIQPSCINPQPNNSLATAVTETIFCPAGYLIDKDECILKEECPCFVSNIMYESNITFTNGSCDSCTCISGEVVCPCVSPSPSVTSALSTSPTVSSSLSTSPSVSSSVSISPTSPTVSSALSTLSTSPIVSSVTISSWISSSTTPTVSVSPTTPCVVDMSACVVNVSCRESTIYNGMPAPSSYPDSYQWCQDNFVGSCCPQGSQALDAESVCVVYESSCRPCDYCMENGTLVPKQDGEVCMILGCPCVCTTTESQSSMYCDPACAEAKTTPHPIKTCARVSAGWMYVNVSDCISASLVENFWCHGYCDSLAHVDLQAGLVNECTCCRPSFEQEVTIPLNCVNGSTVSLVYDEIIDCGCLNVCDLTS